MPAFRNHALSALLLCLSSLCLAPAQAQSSGTNPGSGFLGLLPVRDLTPFGFRRLDMRPGPAVTATEGKPILEWTLGYQNTWSMSGDVEEMLEARPRGPITQADVDRISATPGEHYLVDMEMGLLEVTLRYALGERTEVYGTLGAAQYSGGFLDGAIEGFHKTFGLDQSGRRGASRNRMNVYMDLKGVQATELDVSDEGGLVDPVLGIRHTLLLSDSAQVVAEGAIKLPIGDTDLLSTGRVDAGAQLTFQKFLRRHAFYVSGALVYFAGSPAPFSNASMFVPTVILGYEYRWLEATNLVAQFYTSRSTFTKSETDLDELRGLKHQVSLGVRHRMFGGHWTAAVTENVLRFANTPDVGFTLVFAHGL